MLALLVYVVYQGLSQAGLLAANVATIGPATITANQTTIVVKYSGPVGDVNQLFLGISDGSSTVYLTPVVGSGCVVYPVSGWISSSGYLLAYRTHDVISAIERCLGETHGRLYAYLAGPDMVAHHTWTRVSHGTLVFWGGGTGSRIPRSGGRDIVMAIISAKPSNVFRAISVVYGGRAPRDIHEAAWQLSMWLSRNTRYHPGYGEGVETPGEFLSTREGRCADYAVFSAAILSALGAPSYVYVVSTPMGLHAYTVFRDSRGGWYVVDQGGPVVALGDYHEYVLPSQRPVIVYRVVYTGSGYRVEIARPGPSSWDDYPGDTIPRSVLVEACRLAASRAHTVCSPLPSSSPASSSTTTGPASMAPGTRLPGSTAPSLDTSGSPCSPTRFSAPLGAVSPAPSGSASTPPGSPCYTTSPEHV